MAPAKSKNQKMSLGDFLQDETLGSWADEMEDMPVAHARTGYGERRGFGMGDRGMGFGDGGFAPREQLPLPDKPPFTAHIGNLSFEVTEGDVTDYFSGCEVTNVRLVEDKLERKPKGFGYVEFATLDGLKKALDLSGSQFNGRNVRVNVAEPPKDRPDARDFGDWTRKGPLPELPRENRRASDRGGFGSRNFDNSSDAGSDRGERRRPPFEPADSRVPQGGTWERRGPLPPAPGREREEGRPRTHDGPRDRRQSPAIGGEGGSQEGSRPPRRDFSDRPPIDRQPTAPEMDNQWRTKMRPDPVPKSPTPTQETSTPSSPAGPPAPAQRPKLNLQKRTVSTAEATSPASAASTDSKANPFGAAKPIDTFAKEKEIEEKRQLALRQKKEHEDKVKEEKRLAKEAAKAEKAAAAAAHKDQNENGSPSTPQPGFEVLQEQSENDPASKVDNETEEVGATGERGSGPGTDDKAVKPKTIIRNPRQNQNQNRKSESSWRSGSADKKSREQSAEPSAEVLEEDGWSTVSKSKSNRKGASNQPTRAIAS